MAIYNSCPICNNSFVKEKIYTDKGHFYEWLTCEKEHLKFSQVIVDSNKLDTFSITLSLNPLIRVAWLLSTKEVFIAKGDLNYIMNHNSNVNIPYIEPDFSNYEKLLNKIKTYSLFL